MRFEIVEQSAPEEPVLRLRLEVDDDDGSVDLVSVDEYGEVEYYLLGIQENGRVIRYSGVGEETGLNRDDDGRVIVEDHS